jgi:exopolysaccharide biosynthesis protein
MVQRHRLGFVVTALTLLAAGRVHAGDVTKDVADGVTMITRTTSGPNNVIHVLVVDMTKPGVSLGATASSARKQRTSSFASAAGAAAAINGDLFSYTTYATTGLAAGGHMKWADTKDTSSSANIAFSDGARVEIHDAAETLAFDSTWMKGVVSGHPQLVKAGVKLATNPASPACPTRNPRTAVGLSQDGTKVYMVVVDGRTTASVGMTCTELATLMKGLGAYQAINLDGGGSTTMVLRGTGIVNHPSDGAERVVANHLAVYAPKLGTVGTVKGLVYEEADPTHVLSGASVTLANATVTTDDTGHYELDGVPGADTLAVMRPGYATAAVTVTITKGGTITADIGLAIDPTADFDGDGVADARDTCAEVADPEQLDADGDGIGDACDLDDDADGVADEDDNCPVVPNADQADDDTDGIGDVCVTSGGCSTTGSSSWLTALLAGALWMCRKRRRRLTPP